MRVVVTVDGDYMSSFDVNRTTTDGTVHLAMRESAALVIRRRDRIPAQMSLGERPPAKPAHVVAKETKRVDVARLARSTDPPTSLEAARLAAKASRKAVDNVRLVMVDGVARTDEELWQSCRASGYVASLDTVQHGRLALSEVGILEDTGETRDTSNGCKSRVWRMPIGGGAVQ